MGNSETGNAAVISDEVIEIAGEAVYESVRVRMGFPSGWDGAPEPIRNTYRKMGRAALESGLSLLRTEADIREARATELEYLGDFIRGSKTKPLHDSYTLRKISVEASKRANEIRNGVQ